LRARLTMRRSGAFSAVTAPWAALKSQRPRQSAARFGRTLATSKRNSVCARRGLWAVAMAMRRRFGERAAIDCMVKIVAWQKRLHV
jgi:hypothetical protein